MQLDEIEAGMRQLKAQIIYQYVETLSPLTWCTLAIIFAGLAFTFYKVNRMVNKAHMF